MARVVDHARRKTYTIGGAVLIMGRHRDDRLRFVHGRAREERRSMAVVAHAEQDQVEARPRGAESAQGGGVGLGSGSRLQFRFDAVDVVRWDGHMRQQHIPRLSVTIARVAHRHAALIAPENVDARPVDRRSYQQAVGGRRCAASAQRYKKLSARGDGLIGAINKQSCRRLTQIGEVFEDLDVGVHGKSVA